VIWPLGLVILGFFKAFYYNILGYHQLAHIDPDFF
jgi:hypothetical protein